VTEVYHPATIRDARRAMPGVDAPACNASGVLALADRLVGAIFRDEQGEIS
jgi:hypothetical protein